MNRSLRHLGAVLLALLVFAAILAMRLPFSLSDGPFFGRPRADCDALPLGADQVYPIGNGTRLETHDARKVGESATVLLRKEDGTILWCVQADGHNPGDVASVRFDGHSGGLIRNLTVVGQVRWTFGHEATWWELDQSGSLVGYRYSW